MVLLFEVSSVSIWVHLLHSPCSFYGRILKNLFSVFPVLPGWQMGTSFFNQGGAVARLQFLLCWWVPVYLLSALCVCRCSLTPHTRIRLQSVYFGCVYGFSIGREILGCDTPWSRWSAVTGSYIFPLPLSQAPPSPQSWRYSVRTLGDAERKGFSPPTSLTAEEGGALTSTTIFFSLLLPGGPCPPITPA